MPALTDTPPLPAHLQVEVTSACNLRCTMCLVRYRPPVNKLAGAMRPELFHALVAELPLRQLTLQGLGEPLLSPYLPEMIASAVRRGVRVGFNTNGTLLSRRRADELVASRVDWLHVSLDGAGPAVYEAIREGAHFDTVIANLAGLVAAKRAAGSATPWIRVVFVAMRDNVAELPALVRLLAGIGVNELRVQNLSHSFDDATADYTEIRDFTAAQALWTGADLDRARAAFAEASAAARDSDLNLRLPHLDEREATGGGCTWPWDAAYVTSTGVVQPCCMVMGDDRVSLGDLNTASFTEIWHGEPYRDFRRRLNSAEPPDVCRGCSLYRHTF
ncbi:coenzyme PQQ synthesis protein E [Actinoplanes sp. SE50]|uniref:radical SAM protein n=1 Tax=unclassified Actinoplanes TaxID=2626549 RepID=UPI00023EC22D|nr:MULTISPECIES: radical SAM protein [unclassified Actinoplanes]AEV82996.1 Coenzyme PQQ synthesis protein E [Actinoplanes sp. SE50/110]ATO81392.1 coenzyme PQQ synthesis protein E [Actinoplanes sp. SE50]SLL98799.1 coenzyme PQQ synthesis protein E [Actinoplanes sp. SE50/110]